MTKVSLFEERFHGAHWLDPGAALADPRHEKFAGEGNTIDTGAADARAALALADAASAPMLLPAGATFRIDTDLTLTGKVVGSGGVLKPASGVTVTIAGPFDAGLFRCFDHSLGGTVTFGAQSAVLFRPQWWGATGAGITDDGPAIQFCADATEAAGGGSIVFSRGSYLINTQVLSGASDVTLELGDAAFLNTQLIPVVARNGLDTNPMFLMTGNRVRVHGGRFLDGLSQGILITGDFTSGDTYTGAAYTEGHQVVGTTFQNCEGDALQIRFFRNVEVRGIVVRDKGAGLVSSHASEVAAQYGTDARFIGCSVDEARNGGGFYALYVDGLTWSGCYANVTNAHAASKQSCDGYYAQFCKNVSLTGGSKGFALEGGTAFKASRGCERVDVVGCVMEVAGSGSNPYAAILLQGVNGFTVTDCDLKSPTAIYTVRAEFHSTPLSINTRNGRIRGNRITGGGVYKNQATTDGIGPIDRGYIDTDDNRLFDGSIYALQISPAGSMSGNRIYSATDFTTTAERAAIFADRCYGMIVEKNHIMLEDATNQAKVGIIANIPSYNAVRDNTIIYTTAVALSVGYQLVGASTATYWERNEVVNAGQKFSGITSASQLERVSANWGDSAATLVPGTDREVNRWESPIAAPRAITLSSTGAYNGARFLIVRTAAATGASTLDIASDSGAGSLKSLAVSQWALVEHNGTDWMLVSYGAL